MHVIDYHYGFAMGKPMPRSAAARILGVPLAEAKLQKELVRKSQEALFDNFSGTHVDMLLAQFDEEAD